MRYTLEPADNYLDVYCGLVEGHIRPGHTVTFHRTVDLTQVQAIRAQAKAAGRVAPSYTAFVTRTVGLAMREFPDANRRVFRPLWWPLRRRFQRFENADVSIAIEHEPGGRKFVAYNEICRDADAQSLDEINAWLREVASADRSTRPMWADFQWAIEKLPPWLTVFVLGLSRYLPKMWVKNRGAAALISSPAKYGVQGLSATWPMPIGVSFGYVAPRPFVVDGQLEVRPTFDLVMNFDRRVIAGAEAARLFARMVEMLEHARVELADLPAHDESREEASSPRHIVPRHAVPPRERRTAG